MSEPPKSSKEHVAKYFERQMARHLGRQIEALAVITKKIDDCDFHTRYLQCSVSLELAKQLYHEQSPLLNGLDITRKRVLEISTGVSVSIEQGDLSPLDPRIAKIMSEIEHFEQQYKKYYPIQRLRRDMALYRKCELEAISMTPEDIQSAIDLWTKRLEESPVVRLRIFCYEKTKNQNKPTRD